MGMVRGSVHQYRLGGRSALLVFARQSLQVGGKGLCRFLSPPSPLVVPSSRPSSCMWQVVQSGCPLPSLAGTGLGVGCAFRELGPVVLVVRAVCPLCACSLALPRFLRLPSPVLSRARTPRGSSRSALVGPFQVFLAPPRFLLESSALLVVCVYGGGGHPLCLASPFPVACTRPVPPVVGWVWCGWDRHACACSSFRPAVGGRCQPAVSATCGRDGLALAP